MRPPYRAPTLLLLVLVLVPCVPLALVTFWSRDDPPRTPGHGAPPAAFARVYLEPMPWEVALPVFLTAPPRDSTRVFLLEKGGLVRVVRGGVLLEAPWADLAERVSLRSEQGLLGMAFHPRYPEDPRVFLNFTDRDGDTRVISLRASPGGEDRADEASEREVLRVDQPWSNHNGGHLCFGPDGYLYVGLGDGGRGGDPLGSGQDRGTLLGSMLRLDVDVPEGTPYAIPPDNPYVGHEGFRPELWAWGLRNPWRYAFDRKTGDLYIADVGQDRFEEVDVQPAGSKGGENYGWNIVEGLGHCFRERDCDQTGLVQPVVEYGRDVGCSITGGVVYRGLEVPELSGLYFYADYCTGVIRSFRHGGGEPRDVGVPGAVRDTWDWTAQLNPGPRWRRTRSWSSFGEDSRGEVYILSLDGPIFRFARSR
ncbi:MAG: PQQ-dependent sugar dehydrogenase [Planctomycetes bacterium]|nr:PQQ-dependent sugar dehydrogenase [Planctomycetota bacterium]